MIKFMRLYTDAKIPKRSREGDAGFDLYAYESVDIPIGGQAAISTGIAMAIPDNYVGQIWPRSGLAVKSMINVHAGIVDSNYRGEVQVCLINHGDKSVEIRKGDRVAQIVVLPIVTMGQEVLQLDETERGGQGFGSSGV